MQKEFDIAGCGKQMLQASGQGDKQSVGHEESDLRLLLPAIPLTPGNNSHVSALSKIEAELTEFRWKTDCSLPKLRELFDR